MEEKNQKTKKTVSATKTVQKPKSRAKRANPQNAQGGTKTAMSAPDKLMVLVTVVNREKTEFYVDLLHNFDINLQMVLNGKGTATSRVTELLGLVDHEKSVIISIVRKDRVKEALDALDEKFTTVRNGKGVAYTVPMSSVIGVAIYQFISNKTGGGII